MKTALITGITGQDGSRRDWGYAPEYVEAMWLMLQAPEPEDFVIATGEMHTVREFVEAVFSLAGLDWRDYVVIDPAYFRPTEVDELCGDPPRRPRSLAGDRRRGSPSWSG